MSITQVCRRCSDFNPGNNYCNLHKKSVSQWNDWCSDKEESWRTWRVKGNIGEFRNV